MDKRVLSALVTIAVFAGTYMYWQQPKDFDDCVLKYMSGTTNKEAARMIYRSCQEKYPERPAPDAKSRNLDLIELSAISGRAGLAFGNYFSGSLYNGNEQLTITRVEVLVQTNIDKQPSARNYIADVTIPPKTTKDFGFNIVVGDAGAEYQWQVATARGYD